MEIKIARMISYIFHPLLTPCYILILLLNINSIASLSVPFSYKLTLTGVVLVLTVLLPLLFTWLLMKVQYITSLFMTTKEERVYPILSIAIFYYVTYYLLKEVHISAIFSYYMLGATLVAILALIINFYSKISLHTLAIGSFTGLFLGLSLNFGINFTPEIITGILLAGIIGFARLKSNAHKPSDVYYGFLAGTVTLTTLIILL
ncbi:MAG: hypothetical protein NT004_08390 [Bacteroidetes bacterium]|nr:hypothetical protein [Bacteroidota bacterium]